MRRLLLWDIDGTLIRTGGVSHTAFEAAISQIAGQSVDGHLPSFDGKTDPLIARETFRSMGFPDADLTSLVRKSMRLLGPKTAELRREYLLRGGVLPGVNEVLTVLQDHAVLNTVLTGNIAVNAVFKLDTFRLIDYFDMEIGAFGSDAIERDDLPDVAIDRANNLRNQWFAGDGDGDVWIIGDTPRDAQAAKKNGLSCLLVATGKYSVDELRACEVDEVVADLTDTERIISLLTE